MSRLQSIVQKTLYVKVTINSTKNFTCKGYNQ